MRFSRQCTQQTGETNEKRLTWAIVRRKATLALLACVSALACASVEERPRTEDDARQLAPLPACIVQLDGSRSKRASGAPSAGVVRSLREEQIWSLVYPGFDPSKGALPEGARACTGRMPLEKDVTEGTSTPIDEGAISLGGGSDRLKIAWLRSHTFPDGSVGGAVALLRTFEGTAEVYAVGSYHGRPKTLFMTERMGPEVVIVAQNDGCTGRAEGTPCETMLTVFRPRFGVLERIADIAQERVTYTTNDEPGIRGKVEHRLSSSAQFVEGGIRVLEQILVRDALGREIRRAELERSYTFAPDGTMVVDEDSLWSRLVTSSPRPRPSTPSAED